MESRNARRLEIAKRLREAHDLVMFVLDEAPVEGPVDRKAGEEMLAALDALTKAARCYESTRVVLVREA